MDIKQSMQGFFSFGEYELKSVIAANSIESLTQEGESITGSTFSSMLDCMTQEDSEQHHDTEISLDQNIAISISPIAPNINLCTPQPDLSSPEFCKIYKSDYTSSISLESTYVEPEFNTTKALSVNPSTYDVSSQIVQNTEHTTDTAPAIETLHQYQPESSEKISQDTNVDYEATADSDSQKSNESIDTTITNAAIDIPNKSANTHPFNKIDANIVHTITPLVNSVDAPKGNAPIASTPVTQAQSPQTILPKLETFDHAKTTNTPIKSTALKQTDFFHNFAVKDHANDENIESLKIETLETKLSTEPQNKLQDIHIDQAELKEDIKAKPKLQESETLESIKFNLSKSVIEDKKTITFILKPKELGRIQIKFENLDTKLDASEYKVQKHTNVSIVVESKESLNLLHTIKGEIEAAISSKLGADSQFSLELSMDDKNQNESKYMQQRNQDSQIGFAYEEDESAESSYSGEITLTDDINVNLVI